MIDAHCHILPKVDDGAKNIRESEQMLKEAKECGIDKVIFTSHIKHDYANYEAQRKAYDKVKPIAKKIGIKTAFGCEVHWKKLAEYDFADIKKFKMGQSNLFLLEFSYPGMPDTWKKITNKLKKSGYKVVIAHPERYKSVHENYKQVKEFKDAGCLIMMSAQSLNKELQKRRIYKTAKKLLKKQYLDIIASDAHSVPDYPDFINALKFAEQYDFDIRKSEKILQGAF